jgi:hypothetical protein
VDAPLCPDHYRQTLDRVRAELSGGWHAGAAKTRKARKRRLQFEADDELEVEAGISTQAG